MNIQVSDYELRIHLKIFWISEGICTYHILVSYSKYVEEVLSNSKLAPAINKDLEALQKK